MPSSPAAGEAEVVALAELLRMEDQRSVDPARLPTHFQAAHPEIRARAALAAGRIADRRALPLLLAAADDSTPRVRAAAVFALGRMGDTASVVVERLSRALAGNDTAALEAPAALARLNTPAAYAAVLRVLSPALASQPAASGPLLREALLALWRFTARPGAAEAVLAHAGHADPQIRWAAVYNFARAAAPAAAVPRLLELAADPDALVRATALRTLRPAIVDSAGQRAAARAALTRALGGAHPHVRINAARGLAAFRESADGSAIAQLLRDADGNVRVAAAEALATVPGEASVQALRSLAQSAEATLALRSAALSALVRHDSAGSFAIASEWSRGGSWLQRFYAARALGALRVAGVQPVLRTLATDADARVQGEAFGALVGSDTTAALNPFLLEGLAAPDPLVRAAAASGLGRSADPAYLSALLQAYDRAQRDSINDAALAALDALDRLSDRGVPVAASFFLRFPASRDPIVRARVAQHFGTGAETWGEPRPIATGRDARFYEDVVRRLVLPQLGDSARLPRVRIRTARGDVVLELDGAHAPLTVHNFLSLITSGFYQRAAGLRWHRVVPNFVLQDGDPRGDGSGGPPHVIRDEINTLRYDRGALGMALSGPDTGGSQFFITHSPQPHLDGGYTIFGRVVEGMAVADAIVQDDAILAIEVVQ